MRLFMISADSLAHAPITLGLLTPHNPFDRRTFSGTPHFAARALARHPALRLRILGGHKPPGLASRLLHRSPRRLTPDTPIDLAGLDAVLGLVASPLLDALARRHPNMPYLHVTDATPAFLRDIYGWEVPETADLVESRVAKAALSVIYSSDAMAGRAAGDLGLDTIVSDVAPFGVNLEALPPQCPPKAARHRLELLFVGLDWDRKGGDLAVATLDRLRAGGQDTHLTVVGRCPEHHQDHPAITYAGFLDKNRTGDAATMNALYARAHFLLVPSRADCTPMVIGEAMAHGTPVLARDTGGIASLLGPAGKLMSAGATPDDWAEAIIAFAGEGYEARADACFARAASDLSWDGWADKITSVLGRRLRWNTAAREQNAA